MKKFLRNTSLFIITLMLVFGFAYDVDAAAAECEALGITDSNQCRVTDNRTIIVAGNGFKYRKLTTATQNRKTSVSTNGRVSSKGYNTNYYSDIGIGNSFGGVTYNAYRDSYSALFCLDAQYEGYNPMYAERFLLDTSESGGVKAFDVAIMYILLGGGNDNIITAPTSGNAADYWARLAAIRAVEYTFGYFNDADVKYKGAFYANLTLVNTWINEDSSHYDALYTAMNGYITSKSYFAQHTNYYFNGSPVEAAKNYYYGALDAAVDYINNAAANRPTIDVTTVLPAATEVEVDEREEGDFVSKDVVHTIRVSGLPKNGQNSFIINGLKFVDNTVYTGLTAYISSIEIGDVKIEGRYVVEQILGQDFLAEGSSFDFAADTEIKITVHFEGYETADDDTIEVLKCGQAPIRYYIDGTYTSSEFGEYSNYVATIWYSGESEAQRFIGIERTSNNTNESTWKTEYETYLIDACDCNDLIDACKASGSYYSDECQELRDADCGECAELEIMCHYGVTSSEHPNPCDEYGAVCEVECPTAVDTFNCCDANNNLIISPLDNWEVNITGPDDVYACFVSQIDGQVDLQGEGVGAETVGGAVDDEDNSYTLEQNRYCVVSCKEDYKMTMPTAKLVNAGRYFTFKAAVEGTKTCYTNTIDRDLYEEDIQAAQIRLVEAFNEWLRVYTASQTEIEEVSRSCCSACGGSYNNYYLNSTSPYSYGYTIGSDGRISIYRTSGLTYSDSSTGGSSCPCSSYSCGQSGTSCCGRYCSYCRSGRRSDIESRLATALQNAETELRNAQTNYQNIISEYNSCSTWETEIKYDPEVYYDYEESYLDDFYNGYGEMDKVISNANTSEWYCNSNVSSSGSENQATLSGGSYDSCSLSTTSSTRYTSINYVYCTESGCAFRSENISDARYKKITSSVNADYQPSTLFYNIYPSGEITDTPADNNVAIENGLPVSLSTKRGIYKYTVNMTNLGEYYDQDGDLGRLIGGTTAVINKDEYNDFVDENGTVQYACSYLVNMGITDEDTIVCDFDTICTGDDCIADCIGPNCDYECNGDNCIADCIGAGCIYDSDAGTSLIERVVSLTNLFPNGTNSYNWNRDANDKAATTIDEIEEAGNSVYDEDPILSVTITPSLARAIKQYNDDAEDHGGYSNSTLSCFALGNYEEIACYSSFITGLLEGNIEYDGVNYINNIDVVNDRSLIMGNNYRTVRDDNTEYFTTWSTGISENDMIGPSWK